MGDKQQLRYDGLVAVITGAGAGLGREYALLFAKRGAKVVVNDLGGSHSGEGASKRAADVVVDEIRAFGGTAVADYNSVVDGDKVIDTAIKNFGRVDILVNNAGILRDRSLLKISEQDWNLVHDVHLKGSFKCTQAAFPHMKKNNFGRIIMTSSNSGIYGNFGQANYSAAKMGLIGLANTVAIEGGKYNIHCNTIIPTAASRLTKGIIPDMLFDELKPELIAPVVAYLCHESCEDNGSYIESAAGWASKLEIVRGSGAMLRKSIKQFVITPEEVQEKWSKVTDMSMKKKLATIGEASTTLMQKLEDLKEGRLDSTVDTFTFNSKDLALYALGVGATTQDPRDLKFLYENDAEFTGLPTFFIQAGLQLTLGSDMVARALPEGKTVDFTRILHGEQYLEICDTIPTSGTFNTTAKVVEVLDKGSGAVVIINTYSYDENGTLVFKSQNSIFVVGAGGFGGKKTPSANVVAILPAPKRAPDAVVHYKTQKDQAALYRLSGDLNPLHIDPQISAMAGYKTPILHGLCTLGFSVRAVLATYADNNPALFKAVKVRFAAPVIPGQTLKIDMWREGKRVHFRTSIAETNKEVITGAYVELKEVHSKL